MSEQQDHLKNLLTQRESLISEINALQAQASEKRELLLRASGAIEYLQQVGVKLPEAEPEAPEAPEAPATVVEESLPEPTVSTNFN